MTDKEKFGWFLAWFGTAVISPVVANIFIRNLELERPAPTIEQIRQVVHDEIHRDYIHHRRSPVDENPVPPRANDAKIDNGEGL